MRAVWPPGVLRAQECEAAGLRGELPAEQLGVAAEGLGKAGHGSGARVGPVTRGSACRAV